MKSKKGKTKKRKTKKIYSTKKYKTKKRFSKKHKTKKRKHKKYKTKKLKIKNKLIKDGGGDQDGSPILKLWYDTHSSLINDSDVIIVDGHGSIIGDDKINISNNVLMTSSSLSIKIPFTTSVVDALITKVFNNTLYFGTRKEEQLIGVNIEVFVPALGQEWHSGTIVKTVKRPTDNKILYSIQLEDKITYINAEYDYLIAYSRKPLIEVEHSHDSKPKMNMDDNIRLADLLRENANKFICTESSISLDRLKSNIESPRIICYGGDDLKWRFTGNGAFIAETTPQDKLVQCKLQAGDKLEKIGENNVDGLTREQILDLWVKQNAGSKSTKLTFIRNTSVGGGKRRSKKRKRTRNRQDPSHEPEPKPEPEPGPSHMPEPEHESSHVPEPEYNKYNAFLGKRYTPHGCIINFTTFTSKDEIPNIFIQLQKKEGTISLLSANNNIHNINASSVLNDGEAVNFYLTDLIREFNLEDKIVILLTCLHKQHLSSEISPQEPPKTPKNSRPPTNWNTPGEEEYPRKLKRPTGMILPKDPLTPIPSLGAPAIIKLGDSESDNPGVHGISVLGAPIVPVAPEASKLLFHKPEDPEGSVTRTNSFASRTGSSDHDSSNTETSTDETDSPSP